MSPTSLALCTFQRRTRVAQLRQDGVLVSDWERLPRFERATYPAMVRAMERAGIDTGGHPPVWAWHGRPTLLDACALFDPEHELSEGFATVEFTAPADLVLLSDYGEWNDHLDAWFTNPEVVWEPGPHSRTPEDLPQACVPLLRVDWVRGVRDLPTTGWDDLDPGRPA